MDLEMSQVWDLDIPLTEVELAEVDNLILETERLEMDENMLDIDNDDLLGDSPDRDAEKIEAISQLSPANAVITKAAPPAQLPLKEKAILPPHEPTTEAQPPYVPKGLLKKKSPRSPDIKGSNASKKLLSLLSRASPKKKTALGKKQSSSSTMVPRTEVFPSASRKKTLSLSGSVVSQKPPSKKI
ncbi:unnamed protein product [Brassica rapa subsp. trilocularis]